MSIRKRLKSGFTLVELMIVVAIIGILAVLAVYGVKKYMANAKTAEARQNLGRLGKDIASSYEGEHMDPKILAEAGSTAITRQLCAESTNKSVPATTPKGIKYQSSAIIWKPAADATASPPKGWTCLRFELNTPQYYRYTYAPTNIATSTAAFTASADGDLDGNGTTSYFELVGKVASTRLIVSPTIKEVDAEE